ncbi:MAG: transposase [Caldilineaceae bacterium SB0664_bin_27]|uniref:Transposase n=1 Tax=Caldilineaceae bacterium SB0664_bin_27 TaxID=2605260 RepID=A0A6B0YPN1_9CHLR|nr:transposase [Caldilineaceae bacterium SB0664_bin_27]
MSQLQEEDASSTISNATPVSPLTYRHRERLDLLAAVQVEVVIPSRRYRKQSRVYDRIRYRERNIVERFINKIKWYRRIFTCYDKLARRFMAFLHFASTLLWLKRKVNEP